MQLSVVFPSLSATGGLDEAFSSAPAANHLAMMQKFSFSALALCVMCAIPQAWAADLLDTASKSGEIKTFVNAIKTAGLESTFRNQGPFTVFAPANSAFEKLDAEQRESLLKDKNKLAEMVNHHIIAGKTLVSEVKPGNAKALDGSEVTLKSDNGKVTVDGANVTQSDITADNGVIHIVDSLVLPKR